MAMAAKKAFLAAASHQEMKLVVGGAASRGGGGGSWHVSHGGAVQADLARPHPWLETRLVSASNFLKISSSLEKKVSKRALSHATCDATPRAGACGLCTPPHSRALTSSVSFALTTGAKKHTHVFFTRFLPQFQP